MAASSASPSLPKANFWPVSVSVKGWAYQKSVSLEPQSDKHYRVIYSNRSAKTHFTIHGLPLDYGPSEWLSHGGDFHYRNESAGTLYDFRVESGKPVPDQFSNNKAVATDRVKEMAQDFVNGFK